MTSATIYRDEVADRVALVTGSSAGIGEATVVGLAKLGYRVVVHGLNMDRIKNVADKCFEVSPHKYKPLILMADLTKDEEVKSLLKKTIDYYGRLDVLINNAGLYKGFNLEDQGAYDQYRYIMKINMDSAVLLTSLAVPHLRVTRGNIVNVSSTGHMKPLNGGFAYCAAKAALSMFTKSLAVELAPHIRVNAVSPGPVATLMQSRNGVDTDVFSRLVGRECLTDRVGLPEEIANTIIFLVSDQASFLTGSDLIVDGGCTIKPIAGTMGQQKT